MKNKKAEFDFLELIMTYGWVILIVLIAIGALAYFGILSPDKIKPNIKIIQECWNKYYPLPTRDYNCNEMQAIMYFDLPIFKIQVNNICYTNSILIKNETLQIEYYTSEEYQKTGSSEINIKEEFVKKCLN